MLAVIICRADRVKAFLVADVNVQAVCGCTPLMLAACSGDTEITEVLLNSGADANKICRPDKTALVVAIEHGYHAIVELLKRAMGQPTRVKAERLPSKIRSRERTAVLSATN